MIKGLSRRVVVVKSPDPKIFEEAIFIVREEYLNTEGVSTEELMNEARQVANLYAKSTLSRSKRFLSDLPAPAFAAAGAALTGIAWLAMRLVGA